MSDLKRDTCDAVSITTRQRTIIVSALVLVVRNPPGRMNDTEIINRAYINTLTNIIYKQATLFCPTSIFSIETAVGKYERVNYYYRKAPKSETTLKYQHESKLASKFMYVTCLSARRDPEDIPTNNT